MPVKPLHAIVVTEDLRAAVARLADRLAPVQVIAAAGWQQLIDQCRIESSAPSDGQRLFVGPPAFIHKHAALADNGFGVVMPVAQRSRLWQRGKPWRDDAMLDLWRAGWSPQAVDRILVPTDDAVVEFVIADVRHIPPVAGQLDGAEAD